MSNSGRGARYWIKVWLPVAVMLAAIAIESTPWFGSDFTSGPLRMIWEFLFGRVSDAAWGPLHHLLRKTGHFVGYGLLGLALLRAWQMTVPASKFLRNALMALVGTAVVASADEWHQTFLPNRTGRWQDVLLDCGGAVTLLFAAFAVRWLRSRRRLAREA